MCACPHDCGETGHFHNLKTFFGKCVMFRHSFFARVGAFCFCRCKRRSSVTKAASPHATCRLCAHAYATDAGRMHGQFFKCWPCLNAEQTIRRNFGDTQDLQGWKQEECQSFYQRLQQQTEQSGGKLLWKTVRATMRNTLCERALARFASTCEVTPAIVCMAGAWSV